MVLLASDSCVISQLVETSRIPAGHLSDSGVDQPITRSAVTDIIVTRSGLLGCASVCKERSVFLRNRQMMTPESTRPNMFSS